MVNPQDIPDCIAGPPCRTCGVDKTILISSRFGRETSFCIHCGESWEYGGGEPERRPDDDRRSGADRRQDCAAQSRKDRSGS